MSFKWLTERVRVRKVALITVSISVACLVLSFAVRPTPETVAVSLTASSMSLSTSQQLVLEQTTSLSSESTSFGTLSYAEFNGRTASIELAVAKLLARGAPAPRLQSLIVAERSRLVLTSDDSDCLTIALQKGEIRLNLLLGEDSISLVVPGVSGGGSEFVLCPSAPLELPFYGAVAVEFQRDFRPNAVQAYSLSSLAKVSLAFPRLGLERQIVPIGGLRFEKLSDRAPLMVAVGPGTDQLQVKYVGDAFSISTGPPTSRREQMPRLFEHLIGKAPIATLLAGFGFFWGLIWGLVKFYRSSAQV